MAHRCSCQCHCHCHRKMDRPAPIVQNNYYIIPVSAQQVLFGPNQLLQTIPASSSSAKPTNRYDIKNDKLGDKHREHRPIANDKHLKCGTKNVKSGEKHRDARQIASGAANDKKVMEIHHHHHHHHHVKGEPKHEVHVVDAKPRVKCANGRTHHKH